MKGRVNGKWVELLDYDYSDKVLIQVSKWFVIEDGPAAFFTYKKDPRILWNYRNIGLKKIVQKTVSRLRYASLSRKYISIGKGRVISVADGQGFALGDEVVFIALNFPEGLTRIALKPLFIAKISGGTSALLFGGERTRENILSKTLLLRNHVTEWTRRATVVKHLQSLRRFDPNSAMTCPEIDFKEIESILDREKFSVKIVDDSAPHSFLRTGRSRSKKQRGVTFMGWGHHSRTMIAPNIPKPYRMERVHDIDPTVLLMAPKNCTKDSSSHVRQEDRSDVIMVAGYHHTHAAQVYEALVLHKAVVCEKPLCTTWEDFQKIKVAAERSPTICMAYQKRYDDFFESIQRDLDTESKPLKYSCEVYQVQLPENHWYRWPSTGSRILSNGCHWIDHFLALKEGVPVRSLNAFESGKNTIQCEIMLEDDSRFSMRLGEKAEGEMGNSETIELETTTGKVRIVDFEHYVFQNQNGKTIEEFSEKLSVFSTMYTRIFERIESNDFDSISEILRVQETLLTLEDRLRANA